MQELLSMYTTTIGSAAVISIVAVMFFTSKKVNDLNKKNYNILASILFGLLSCYASVSAFEINGAICNCRNLAPLFAGIVVGPIPGIVSAVIGGIFRWLVYGGEVGVACMLACFCSGIIGAITNIVVKDEWRHSKIVCVIASFITEVIHMSILTAFNHFDIVKAIVLPIIIANVCGIFFCMFIYEKCNKTSVN